MSFRIPRIMELLPKKDDCCNCGHCTCEVYAMELVAGRVTVDACPSITTEARRMLSRVLGSERYTLAGLPAFPAAQVKEAVENVLMLPGRIAGFLIAVFPVLAALWLAIVWFSLM